MRFESPVKQNQNCFGDPAGLSAAPVAIPQAWVTAQAACLGKAAFLKVQPNLHHKTPADNPRHLVPSALTFSWLGSACMWCLRRVNHPQPPENELLWEVGTVGITEHIPVFHTDTTVPQWQTPIPSCRTTPAQRSAHPSSLPPHIPPSRHKHGEQSPGISLSRAQSGRDKAAGPDTPSHESKRCQSLKVLWQKASSV